MDFSIKSLLLVLCLFGFFALGLWGLGDSLGPLIFAAALAYLSFPLVKRLESLGLNRVTAVGGSFLLVSLLIAIVLVLALPPIAADIKAFAMGLPQSLGSALRQIEQLGANFGLELNISRGQVVDYLRMNGKNLSVGVFQGFSDLGAWVVGLLNIFLVPLFYFYIILNYEDYRRYWNDLVPPRMQPRIGKFLENTNGILSHYFRGQVLVALILACIYGLGLSLTGLKFGLAIGILSGLLSLIPYFGIAIGIIAATVVSLAHFAGFGQIFAVAGVFIFGQIIESIFITPKLVGDRVGLSAFATLLALILGGNLLGTLGMLVGIPLAAVLKMLLSDLVDEYKKLSFYGGAG